MKNRTVHIKKKFVASIFLLLISAIIFNSTFFLHSHRTACGKIIVHAHPFNKGAEKDNPLSQHEHNKIELTTFSLINYYIFPESTINLDLYVDFELVLFSNPCIKIDSNIYFSHATRGPPVTIS